MSELPEVPPEILKMAYEIDKWAKSQGLAHYYIGPICSREQCPEPDLIAVEPPSQNDIDAMIHALEAFGWKKWRGHHTIWEAPDGQLFRGPDHAFHVAIQHQ